MIINLVPILLLWRQTGKDLVLIVSLSQWNEYDAHQIEISFSHAGETQNERDIHSMTFPYSIIFLKAISLQSCTDIRFFRNSQSIPPLYMCSHHYWRLHKGNVINEKTTMKELILDVLSLNDFHVSLLNKTSHPDPNSTFLYVWDQWK